MTMPHPCHQLHSAEALRFLEVDETTGLTTAEARKRLESYGSNTIDMRQNTSVWLTFLQQFRQPRPLVIILLVAGAVAFYLGEIIDSAVIFSVVLLNAVIGCLQETKAAKAVEALARLVVTETTVRRDGLEASIRSEEIVPGDVVLLRAGDKVPADLRLLSVLGLHCDESENPCQCKSIPPPWHPTPC